MDPLWKYSIETLKGEPADEVQNLIWRARPTIEVRFKYPDEFHEWLKKNKYVLDELNLKLVE